jgi:hypothetical protein
MTMSTNLFRREALEYWSRQRGPDAVLRVETPWVRWLYWMVLGLLIAGLALAFLLRIEQTTSGPATIDPQQRTFVAVLPAASSSDLHRGRPLRLEVDAPEGRQTVAASVLQVRAAEVADVRRAGFETFPQPAVLVTGVLAPDAAAPAGTPSSSDLTGRAVVRLGSKQAFSAFVEGFDEAQGGNG